MPVIAAQLVAKVAVEGDAEAKAKLDSVHKKVDETSKGFTDKLGTALKTGLLVGGAALVALGAHSLKMAGDFQAGLTSLVTGAGELPQNLKLVHDKMLQISADTGTMTDALVQGEYLIDSAGQKGAQALDTLAKSAMGAKVGAASLQDVANGVTTEMTDYAKTHLTAAQATNILIAATADGKTHLGDLASAMASVLPTAAAVNVKLIDVAGAMATMTGEGTPAADAATYLRQMLLALEVPGSKAVKTFQEIGLSTAVVATAMQKSLPDALKLITDHLAHKFPVGSAAYVDALKNMAGGQKNFQAWLELTGTHLADFKSNVVDITQKVKAGGDGIVGWSDVQHDFNFQLDVAHAMLNKVFIIIGENLMPVVSDLLHKYVEPGIKNFQDWATHGTNLHDTLKAVGDVVGGMLATLGTLATDTGMVVGWFRQAGPQGDILKVALTGIGVAIGTIKMIGLASDIATMAGKAADFVTSAGKQLLTMLVGPNSLSGNAATASTSVKMLGTDIAATGAEAQVAGAEISTAGTEIATAGTEAEIANGKFSTLNLTVGGLTGTLLKFAGLGLLGAQIGASQATQQATTANQQYTNSPKIQAEVLQEWEKTFPNLAMAQGDDPFARLTRDQKNLFFQNWLRDFPGQTPPYLQFSAAAGGVVGGLGLVGERGPELVHFPAGTHVYDTSETRSLLGGSGQQSTPVYLQIDGQTLARLLMPYNAGLLRSGLGMVGI